MSVSLTLVLFVLLPPCIGLGLGLSHISHFAPEYVLLELWKVHVPHVHGPIRETLGDAEGGEGRGGGGGTGIGTEEGTKPTDTEFEETGEEPFEVF